MLGTPAEHGQRARRRACVAIRTSSQRTWTASEFDVAVAMDQRLLPEHRLVARRERRLQRCAIDLLEDGGGPAASGAVEPLICGLRDPSLQCLGDARAVAVDRKLRGR